jgi:23S rRNA (cytidine1920-2'-O)/16S rRNA (cytidine1409-2'-O)-methyltransferase
VRLDDLLVQRGHAPTRHQAKALVLEGQVAIGSSERIKPGSLVSENADVRVNQPPQYVSRGGLKLAHALQRFSVDPAGRIAADIGASTGGFTDCLLQRDAARVYAVDVGYGQLHWRIRTDPRVVVLERTNARYLTSLPDPVSLVVVDVSFISLRLLAPTLLGISTPSAEVVVLVKPQFEAGRDRVSRGGVVRDPEVHREVLGALLEWTSAAGLRVVDVTASPLLGPAGNVEFLAHLHRQASSGVRVPGSESRVPGTRNLELGTRNLVEEALAEAAALSRTEGKVVSTSSGG